MRGCTATPPALTRLRHRALRPSAATAADAPLFLLPRLSRSLQRHQALFQTEIRTPNCQRHLQQRRQNRDANRIFEYLYPDGITVFIFDCSSAHEAYASDALLAQKMNRISTMGRQRDGFLG
ncbi:hypothetical protein B0H13DRAFT_2354885 [Mycena leptocephala]|nr:hypothetical protein B0H13DRAFT_2354885 [Mycena leptocephala]